MPLPFALQYPVQSIMPTDKISSAISRTVDVGHIGKSDVPEQPLDLPRELPWSQA
jgi:hypothetical protein